MRSPGHHTSLTHLDKVGFMLGLPSESNEDRRRAAEEKEQSAR